MSRAPAGAIAVSSPGYDVSTAFSEDGQRQAVLMINQDTSTLPKPARALYGRLIDKAYCRT